MCYCAIVYGRLCSRARARHSHLYLSHSVCMLRSRVFHVWLYCNIAMCRTPPYWRLQPTSVRTSHTAIPFFQPFSMRLIQVFTVFARMFIKNCSVRRRCINLDHLNCVWVKTNDEPLIVIHSQWFKCTRQSIFHVTIANNVMLWKIVRPVRQFVWVKKKNVAAVAIVKRAKILLQTEPTT